MKPRAASVAVLLAVLLLTACAPGVNDSVHTANAAGIVAGFWRGLWHGIIAPITFLISLFDSSVQIYEVHNSGGWYNFGFILGALSFHGNRAARRATRRITVRVRTDAQT